MGTKITLDIEQGNILLRHSYQVQVPEKLGERTMSLKVRATITQKIRQCYKALRDVSDILKSKRQLYFGPMSAWIERDRLAVDERELSVTDERVRQRFEMLNKFQKVEVELTGQAKDGLYWLLLLVLHPDSKFCWAAGQQEEMAWPVAAQINATKALEAETGVSSGETIEVKYDDAEVAQAAKSE